MASKRTEKRTRSAATGATPTHARTRSAPHAPEATAHAAAGAGDLGQLRQRIDVLDQQIVELINERAKNAVQIGAIKAREGRKPYAPSREIQVYRKVTGQNRGPLPNDALKSIYREIMSATIALEHPTRIAYFGQPGTFTHLAARTKFGSAMNYIPKRDMREVFLSVSRGEADYGVVPIENSTEGGVNQAIDMFADTRLKIASEIYLPIHQYLLSKSALRDIRIVYSHPQPFAQCRNWLMGNLGEVEKREVNSTAAAAELAAKDPSAAAIGGLLAAEIYNVPIVASHIEDSPDNITRFFVVAEHMAERTGRDKTSLVLSIKDEPGALLRLLQPFQQHRLNLTRIESRPSKRRAWEYNFFLDLEGHVTDEAVKQTLDELNGQVKHLEVLGSYPAAERTPSRVK
jgi:chorismate mutase/prephenate dehydratase